MGEIKKQSILSTLLTNIGFGLGAINLLLLYPRFLSSEELGLTQVIISLSWPLVSIGSLGMGPTINRFFPYFKTHLPLARNDLFKNSLIVSSTGFSILLILAYSQKDFILRKLGKSPLLVEYFYIVPLFALGLMFFNLLSAFTNNNKYAVWTSFCSHVLLRLIFGGLVFLLGLNLFSFNQYIGLYAVSYWVLALVLLGKLWYEKKLSWPKQASSLFRRLKGRMFKYATFYMGIRLMVALSFFIDTIAIAGLKGLKYTAYFTVAMYLVRIVIAPREAIEGISVPFISDAWRKNDRKEIQGIYQKSSSILLSVGGLLFGLIYFVLPDLLSFMPEEYQAVSPVFFILGLAHLLDMAAGLNSQILANSKKHWQVDFMSNGALILTLIPLNFWLIKDYGIIGAAYAKLIAFSLFNLFRGIYLYRVENLSPFKPRMIFGILLIVINLLIIHFVNQQFGYSGDKLLVSATIAGAKALVFIVINLPIVYALKLSDDLNSTLDQIVRKIFPSWGR